MARLEVFGFDTGDASDLQFATAGCSFVSSPVASSGGGYALKVVSGVLEEDWAQVLIPGGLPDVVYTRFKFRYANALPASGREIIFYWNGPGGDEDWFSLRMDSAAKLSLWRQPSGSSSVQLGSTGSTALAANTWYIIEVKIESGAWAVRVNLLPEISGSDTLDVQLTIAFIGRAAYVVTDPNAVTEYYYDDLAFDDTEYPGATDLILLKANGAGALTAWSRGGVDSGSDWGQVDEIPPNGDTDYILSPSSIGAGESVTLENISIATAIVCVKPVATGRRINEEFPAYYKIRTRSGSLEKDSGPLSNSFTAYITRTDEVLNHDTANYQSSVIHGGRNPAASNFNTALAQADGFFVGDYVKFVTGSLSGQYKEIALFEQDSGDNKFGWISLVGPPYFSGPPAVDDKFIICNDPTSNCGGWTVSAVNALEIGVIDQQALSVDKVRVTFIGAVVEFVPGTPAASYTLNADFGSIAIMGKDADLLRSGYILQANAGVINITGQNANLIHTIIPNDCESNVDATDITNNASAGTIAWINPSNALASDDTYATVTFPGSAGSQVNSNYLWCLDPDLSAIPDTAEIVGIQVDFEVKKTGTGENILTNWVQLIVGGTLVGSNISDGTPWAGSDGYITFGSDTFTWGGLTLFGADVKAAGFGVAIQASCVNIGNPNDSVGHVDHVRFTVCYELVVNHYTLSVDAGSIAITGQDINSLGAFKLSADAGVINITGQDMTDSAMAHVLSVDYGVINITGQDVTFPQNYRLSVDRGLIRITGKPVTFFYRAATHYFFDIEGGGFWPIMFAAQQFDPYSIAIFPALADEDLSDMIMGAHDGFVRQFDRGAFADDGSPFTSYIVIGPLLVAKGLEGLVSEIQPVLAESSGQIGWELRVGDGHEEAITAAAQESGTWTDEDLNITDRPRSRGAAFSIRLSNAEADMWSFEEIGVITTPAGERRT